MENITTTENEELTVPAKEEMLKTLLEGMYIIEEEMSKTLLEGMDIIEEEMFEQAKAYRELEDIIYTTKYEVDYYTNKIKYAINGLESSVQDAQSELDDVKSNLKYAQKTIDEAEGDLARLQEENTNNKKTYSEILEAITAMSAPKKLDEELQKEKMIEESKARLQELVDLIQHGLKLNLQDY